jgi:ArsR family transcriptional regulator, lead/cadmium/zinc/bismuth-responsive transcriptional repressor
MSGALPYTQPPRLTSRQLTRPEPAAAGGTPAPTLDAPASRDAWQLLDHATADALAATFRVLADPTRVKLLAAMTRGECCVRQLADAVGMSGSAVSHQLRVLRHARIVKGRRAGRLVYYALDDHHVQALFRQALSHVADPHPHTEAPR